MDDRSRRMGLKESCRGHVRQDTGAFREIVGANGVIYRISDELLLVGNMIRDPDQ